MLEVAAEKHIYDQLVKSDVLFFLANKNAEFDLIIAGDLLVYFGELRQLFSAYPSGFATEWIIFI